MNIDINTKMITLLGSPLAQSFAAAMQNNVYEASGLNLLYFYTETTEAHLGEIIGGIRHQNYAGFAVTKPNKIAVLKYLDRLDPACEKIGACNTVVCEPDGRLAGYNTDSMGFYTALSEDAGICPEGLTGFCVGAGGVGRPICFSLAEHGIEKLFIMDLFENAAKQMAEELEKAYETLETEVVSFGDFSRLSEADLIINASGVGMGKTIGETPVPAEYIEARQFCFDACYNPARTRFLQDAEAKGCKVLNGLSMSRHQGAAQIELWTGKKIPDEVMSAALEKAMR